MTLRSSTFNILLLSTDSEIQAHYKDLFGEQAVTISRDGLSLPKEPAKRAYDAVLVESKAQSAADLGKLFGGIDPARTLLVVGSRTVLKRTAASLHAAKTPKADLSLSTGNGPAWSGSSKLFEVVYLLWWYVGPLNQQETLNCMGAGENVRVDLLWAYWIGTGILID